MKKIRVACILLGHDYEGDVREGRLKQALSLLGEAGTKNVDIAVLPEAFADAPGKMTYEAIDGPTISAVSKMAQAWSFVVVAPIGELETDGAKRNTAVIISREGKTIGRYCKNIPFWCEEGVTPGEEYCVFDTDAGRFGVLICFESNWPDPWMELGHKGADLVIWPSAYSAGRKLLAPAIYNNYYVISCTLVPDTTLVDICGDQVAFAKGGPQVAIHEIDLDRTMVHDNFNRQALLDLQKDMGSRVEMRYFDREGWWLVESNDPQVSVRELLKERGIETLREYTQRSKREIYELRRAQRPLPELSEQG